MSIIIYRDILSNFKTTLMATIDSGKSLKDTVSKASVTNILFSISTFLLLLVLNDMRNDLKEVKQNQVEYISNQKIIQYRLEQLEKNQGVKTTTKPVSTLLFKHEPFYIFSPNEEEIL